MRSPLLDETLEEVAAANKYVRAKEERALSAGRSVYFVEEGHFYERNGEGVFEIVQRSDGGWYEPMSWRAHLDDPEPRARPGAGALTPPRQRRYRRSHRALTVPAVTMPSGDGVGA